MWNADAAFGWWSKELARPDWVREHPRAPWAAGSGESILHSDVQ